MIDKVIGNEVEQVNNEVEQANEMEQVQAFQGFGIPQENWSKLPHALIDALPLFKSKGELMVVLYILRHTWGYQEFGVPKRITRDEFMNGRKRRDGTRMDNGTGLSRASVTQGLKQAVEHGFLEVEMDDHDLGRVKKFYCLRMSPESTPEAEVCVEPLPEAGKDSEPTCEKSLGIESMRQGAKNWPPGGQKLAPRGPKISPRSEKDTLEINLGKINPPGARKKPDLFDLSLKTEQAQERLKHPITVLAEKACSLLGLSKVPNYHYEQNWQDPLADLLDQADQDIGKVEQALEAAARKANENELTITSPASLHSLALEALGNRKASGKAPPAKPATEKVGAIPAKPSTGTGVFFGGVEASPDESAAWRENIDKKLEEDKAREAREAEAERKDLERRREEGIKRQEQWEKERRESIAARAAQLAREWEEVKENKRREEKEGRIRRPAQMDFKKQREREKEEEKAGIRVAEKELAEIRERKEKEKALIEEAEKELQKRREENEQVKARLAAKEPQDKK